MQEQTKVKLDKWIQKLLIAFIILQPFLDIYMVLFDSKIQILGISLATIFRFSVVGILTLLTIAKCPKNRSTKCIIGYGIVVLLYTIVHHMNALKVNDSLMNENITYSFMSEFFYLARLTVPILLIYVIYELKLTYAQVKKMVISSVTIMSLVIILSNLAHMSYIAYSLDNNVIRDSIVCWFQGNPKNYYWEELTSRGFFRSGNQISAILTMLLPITIYAAAKEKKARYWIATFLQLLAMLMVGTRVSVLGGFGILVVMFVLYEFRNIVEKRGILQKNVICFLLLMLIFSGIYQISPFKMRTEYGIFHDAQVEMSAPTQKKEEQKVLTYEEKKAFVEEKIKENEETLHYLNSIYSYEHDVEYWYQLVYELPVEQLNVNRTIVNLLYPRVMELNANPMDKWIGMSFDKTSSLIWPERDFKTHYYSIGLLGMLIFLAPYFIIIAMSGIDILRHIKTKIKMRYLIFPMSLCIAVLAGYLSGHVFNEIFVTIYIALIAGICLNNTQTQREVDWGEEAPEEPSHIAEYLKKLYKKSAQEFYAEVKESLEKNEKKFIVTANPETVMIAENTPAFANALLDEKTTIIPDGVGIELGAKIVGYKMHGTILGVELAKKLFEYGNEMKKSIFLFGAKNEVLSALTIKLKKEYPQLVIAGVVDGYVEDKQQVMQEIAEAKPDIVLVALGIPKQELFIYQNLEKFEKGIFVGVGGSFDVLSGKKKRAPEFFVKYRLEWLYRITKEPKRLKRFVKSNMVYIFKILKIRLQNIGKGIKE